MWREVWDLYVSGKTGADMITLIAKTCPNCGRLRKDHTRWQKEACGRVMSEWPPIPKDNAVLRADWRKN